MGGKATIEREALVSDDGSFRVLPVETVVKIASQLVVSDVMKFSMASHGLQQYIRDSYNLWNFLLQRDFQKSDDEVDPVIEQRAQRARVRQAIKEVSQGVCQDIARNHNYNYNYIEIREVIEQLSENFDYAFFEELDQGKSRWTADQFTSTSSSSSGSSSGDDESDSEEAPKTKIHLVNPNSHNNGAVNANAPLTLREEAIERIKFHIAAGNYRLLKKRNNRVLIVPVPEDVKAQTSLTVSRRNKVKDVKRPFDLYKRLVILIHYRGLNPAAEKGYREVDNFIVNNRSEFEKENLKLKSTLDRKVVQGPNVITVALTGPLHAGVSTLLHSLVTNRSRGVAFRPREGKFSTTNNGFYYQDYLFALMRVGLKDLDNTLELPIQGGTVAVVLDGTKPIDESLAYLAQVVEKLLVFRKVRNDCDISLVVFVNKADVASASLPPFADYVKTHLKKIRKVNYAVFYTSPYLPVALDLVWDWMVAYSPKFDSSYLRKFNQRMRGCASCTLL